MEGNTLRNPSLGPAALHAAGAPRAPELVRCRRDDQRAPLRAVFWGPVRRDQRQHRRAAIRPRAGRLPQAVDMEAGQCLCRCHVARHVLYSRESSRDHLTVSRSPSLGCPGEREAR